MVDGIYPASAPMGDRKFFGYNAIDARAAEVWKQAAADDFLGGLTWGTAEMLGYEVPWAAAGDEERGEA
jgi:hypothetical protein